MGECIDSSGNRGGVKLMRRYWHLLLWPVLLLGVNATAQEATTAQMAIIVIDARVTCENSTLENPCSTLRVSHFNALLETAKAAIDKSKPARIFFIGQGRKVVEYGDKFKGEIAKCLAQDLCPNGRFAFKNNYLKKKKETSIHFRSFDIKAEYYNRESIADNILQYDNQNETNPFDYSSKALNAADICKIKSELPEECAMNDSKFRLHQELEGILPVLIEPVWVKEYPTKTLKDLGTFDLYVLGNMSFDD
ncbi:MAG: hypothetical protein MJK04_27010, partial [Psychrosphaera sp.]|nr:hypothetical protein [Psychrosphaera sp.]